MGLTVPQHFSSYDPNAPIVCGVAGTGISLLDACLKDGYEAQNVSSITRSGSTCTVTLSGLTTRQPGSANSYGGSIVTGIELNFEGTNGGTTFTDSGPAARVFTPTSATTSNTQFKDGTTSGAFLSGGSVITTPSATASVAGGAYTPLDLGSANINVPWTIEAWIYPTSYTAGSFIASQNWSIGWGWFYTSSAFTFSFNNNATTVTSATVPALNTWSHVAVTHRLDLMVGAWLYQMWLNGACIAFTYSNGTFPSPGAAQTFNIGTGLTGYMDLFRLVGGRALYHYGAAGNAGVTLFTPPSAAGSYGDPVGPQVGEWFKIAGSGGGDYDGTFQITSVPSPRVFTFTIGTTPATPATGTITARKAPLGYAKTFTGTNVAVYRSANMAGNRGFLRVDDTGTTSGQGAREMQVFGYSNMTDINTGTDKHPQYGFPNPVWNKSNNVDAGARAWNLSGDDRTFYYRITTGAGGIQGACFGDFISFKPGDNYNTVLIWMPNASYDGTSGLQMHSLLGLNQFVNAYPLSVPRAWTQIGAPVQLPSLQPYPIAPNSGSGSSCGLFGRHQCATFNNQFTSWTVPNPIDGSVYAVEVGIFELNNTWGFRGKLRGLYTTTMPFTTSPGDLTLLPGSPAISGNFMVWQGTGFGTAVTNSVLQCFLMDHEGPW